MKYAVIKTSGSQYQVAENQILEINKIKGEKGQEVVFDQVLLSVNEDKVEIGQPLLTGKKVIAKIEEQFKGKKIDVYKYRPKSRYRRHTGHRDLKTRVKIKEIK